MDNWDDPDLRHDRQAEHPMLFCSICGGEIYRGEDYYLLGSEIVCNDDECLAEYIRTNCSESRRTSGEVEEDE